MLDITVKRDVASSYGILPYTIDNTLDDASAAYRLDHLYHFAAIHVILEVNPKFQYGPERSPASMSNHRAAAGADIHAVKSVVKVAPLVINHQGPVPLGYDLVQSRPGCRDRHAVSAIQRVEKELGAPLSLQTSFQGTPRHSEHR